MIDIRAVSSALLISASLASIAVADVGDPQIRTDHPWYPGELACSTFQRLFETQALLYRHVVGVMPTTDEEKAIASWLWRNTHYWHGEEGAEDLWGRGFSAGGDLRTREYWTGLFAHGFGLCGTTHSQWVAEMQARLGHNRSRGVGVDGHNAFEVFLTGGQYGAGKWVLLDHDLSTIIFDESGSGLLSVAEVRANLKRLTDRNFDRNKQRGWLVCGLHPDDGAVYGQFNVAEYLAGYSAAPPMVHLRRGETMRRYLEPGLDNGRTFVFWGRNDNTAGIPGPERSRTWVNQPQNMYGSRHGAGYKPGQARYANAVYVYRPDFANDYKEGVIQEDEQQVVFEFYTPYIIAATPPNDKPWGIYEPGCRNGLVLRGKALCDVSISTDQGKTWHDAGEFADGMDLTDLVKGHRQYFIRFGAAARSLTNSDITMTTVCQANASIMPRLKDGGTSVQFQASECAVVSAGPNVGQARAHVIEGAFGTPAVTMKVATPRGEPVVQIVAAAHVQSGNPPASQVKYLIDYSTDSGRSWQPMLEDWTISRRGDEPPDFWSQSFCWGSADMAGSDFSSVLLRFSNSGAKNYARGEVHLVYRTRAMDPTKVTFDWTDDTGPHQSSHLVPAAAARHGNGASWTIETGTNVRTRWIEFEPQVPK
jgi:hypothetical protein